MTGDRHHVRRIRAYEFANVVPWDDVIETEG